MVSWAVRKASSPKLSSVRPSAGRGKVGIRSAHHEGMTLGITGGLHVVAGFFSGLFRYFLHQIGVPCGAQTVGLGNMVVGQSVGTTFRLPFFGVRPTYGSPPRSARAVLRSVRNGNVEAGTPRSVERRFIFHPMSGWKDVHALFVGERGILKGLCGVVRLPVSRIAGARRGTITCFAWGIRV